MVAMKNVTRELSELVAEYTAKFNAFEDSEFSNKPFPHKWSKKEVVGHLIDSAQNKPANPSFFTEAKAYSQYFNLHK